MEVGLHSACPSCRADNVVLVRLAHQFAVGEDATLSLPVTVSLTELFPENAIVGIEEVTLTGNQPVSALRSRLHWRSSDQAEAAASDQTVPSVSAKAPLVTLTPMKVRWG